MLNSLYQEPYSRLTKFQTCILIGGDPDVYNQIQILDDLTFDNFLSLKAQWLQNINFQWLIQGHILEKDAIKIAK